MSTNDGRKTRRGGPPRFLVILVLVLVALAGGWTWFWYEASGRAEAALTDWLAAEAAQGRVHACDSRRTGGYPFRFEFVCEAPRMTLAAEPELVATAKELRAVLQVWQPDHVIVEIDGPLLVTPGPDIAEGMTPMRADWDLLQASLRVPYGRLTSVDVAADGFSLRPEPDAATGAPSELSLRADHIELHQREGQSAGAEPAMDLAMSARDLVVSYPGSGDVPPVNLALQGSAVAVTPDLLAHPREFLAAWQEAGGSVAITSFVASQKDTRLLAEGHLRPEPQGRLFGNLTIAMTGPDVSGQGEGGAFGGVAPIVATTLGLMGERTQIDGEPAVKGTLSLRDGRAYLGSFPIAKVPPLF